MPNASGVKPNLGALRSGSVNVLDGNRQVVATVTVEQKSGDDPQPPCGQIGLSTHSISAPVTGASGTLSVTTNDQSCPWSFSQIPNWITFSPSAGQGTQTVSYTVAPNGGPARTANIYLGANALIVSQEGKTHAACDFDGDGKTDVAVFRPGAGIWSILRSSDGLGTAVHWGSSLGDIPVSGDYDGDGKTDIAVYSPGSGMWSILRSSNGLGQAVHWGGLAGDIPVSGDYDGDGKTDIVVYSPGSGMWSILRSSNGLGQAVHWGGLAGDIPVSGDYDGDGKTDIVVYSPSLGGVWSILRSSSGLGRAVTWGTCCGEYPVIKGQPQN